MSELERAIDSARAAVRFASRVKTSGVVVPAADLRLILSEIDRLQTEERRRQ